MSGGGREAEREAVARALHEQGFGFDIDADETARRSMLSVAAAVIVALDAVRSSGGREAEIVAVDVQRFKEAVWAVERENFRPGDALHALERATLRSSGSAAQDQEERLQRAVDVAYGAMNASAYVGGPSEREAWQTASAALSEVVTQHKGQPARSPQDEDHEEKT